MFFLLPSSFSAWQTLVHPSKPNSNVTSSKTVLQGFCLLWTSIALWKHHIVAIFKLYHESCCFFSHETTVPWVSVFVLWSFVSQPLVSRLHNNKCSINACWNFKKKGCPLGGGGRRRPVTAIIAEYIPEKFIEIFSQNFLPCDDWWLEWNH